MTSRGPSREWTEVEEAYSRRLEAAADRAGGAAQVVVRLQRHLQHNDLIRYLPTKKARRDATKTPQEKWGTSGGDWQSTAYRQWMNGRGAGTPPELPVENEIRTALVAVVSKLVRDDENHGLPVLESTPEANGNKNRAWPDSQFADIVALLITERSKNQRDSVTSGAAAERHQNVARLCRIPPGVIHQIDPVHGLGLGSWLFRNVLPLYVPRDPDQRLADRLIANETGLTVVVGPPKSGKSRSVYEVLNAQLPDTICWWHNPAPGTLAELVAAFSKTSKYRSERPGVIVLDDAGFNGVQPTTGLNCVDLTNLASATRVILVVHNTDLSMWQSHVVGRDTGSELASAAIGVTSDLVELLTSHRLYSKAERDVDYPSELITEPELLAVAAFRNAVANNSDFAGLDLTRLAESCAAVDKLCARAERAIAEKDMRAAIVEAAIDAAIIAPAGVDEPLLAELTRLHNRRFNRHRKSEPTQFQKALRWAVTGIAPGSPHSVLTVSRVDSDDEPTHYRLLDALIPKLLAADRNIDHFRRKQLPAAARASAGMWCKEQNRGEEAEIWYRFAAIQHDPFAMSNLAILLWERGKPGDFEEASYWCGKAAFDYDNVLGLHNLALQLWDPEDPDDDQDAEFWWRTAATKHEYGESMFNLAVLLWLRDGPGEQEEAEYWWRKAATEHDHPDAMYNLARLLRQRGGPGEPEEAKRWYCRAATEHDHAESMHTLAYLLNRLGHQDEAERWWRKAANEHSHHDSMYNLAVLLRQRGGPGERQEAELWWHRKDVTRQAMESNAVAQLRAKQERRSRRITAPQHNYDDSIHNLAALLWKRGHTEDRDQAKSLWDIAAAMGNELSRDALYTHGLKPLGNCQPGRSRRGT